MTDGLIVQNIHIALIKLNIYLGLPIALQKADVQVQPQDTPDEYG